MTISMFVAIAMQIFYTPSSKIKVFDEPIVNNPITTEQIAATSTENTAEKQLITLDSIPEILAHQISFSETTAQEKVYLHFDRTFFKPGESIWFNVYVRDAQTLLPSQKSDIVYVEFLAPNGNVEKKLTLLVNQGIAAGDIQLSPDALGGRYKIKAYTNWQRNFETSFERDITVQATVLPNLRMELNFQREAYGAKDEAIADLELKSLENEVLAKHEFSYTASLKGQQILKKSGKTDAKGKATITIQLPKELTTNDGLLNVMIQWNGQTESIARSIPIVLNTIDLQFMPEGGEMVADLASRVGFKALNEFGKPADVEGQILNTNGQVAAHFKSYHQGMGAFDFEPVAGETYTAKITKPEGITTIYNLPKVLEKGVNFKLKNIDEQFLTIQFNSKGVENADLVLHNAGKVFYAKKTFSKTNKFSSNWRIPIKNVPAGIAQLTVFDKNGQPQAERLVFLHPQKKLQIDIKTDKENYLPREKVTMDIAVKDEKGNPTAGQFSLSVADDQLLTFADDKQGNILANLWLESELKGEIVEPNFYFESKEKHPKKDQLLALDYLMMTQGWRRFGFEKEEKAMADFEHKNERCAVGGQVLNSFGKPLVGATVSLSGTSDHNIITDAEGRFLINNVPFFDNCRYLYIKKGVFKESRRIYHWGEDYVIPFLTNESVTYAHHSSGVTMLSGMVSEKESGDPVIYGSVALYKNDVLITGRETDFDGVYCFNRIDPGTYDLEISYVGFPSKRITGIEVIANQNYELNASLDAGIDLQEVVVVGYEVPLVEQDNTTQGTTISMSNRRPTFAAPRVRKKSKKAKKTKGAILTSDQIKLRPVRSVNALAASTAGVSSADDGSVLNIRGSRSGATNYYLDGIRISGRSIPQKETIWQPRISGGTPAAFANQQDMRQAMVQNKIAADKLKDINWNSQRAIVLNITYKSPHKTALHIVDGEIVDLKTVENLKRRNILNKQFLVDSVAIAIYGERAKNGVEFINTRTGKMPANGMIGQKELALVVDQFKAKNEERFIHFNEKEALFVMQLQNGLLEKTAQNRMSNELSTIRQKIYKTNTQIQLFENILKKEKRSQVKNPYSKALSNYNNALNFKTGYYTARQYYRPKYKAETAPQTRNDFRSTIYWNPNIITDENGKVTVEFYNSDALTTFKAVAEGIGARGKIGRGTMTYFTQKQLGMLAKIPTNLMTGDIVEIPVTIANNSNKKMVGQLTGSIPKGLHLLDIPKDNLTFLPKESKTILLKYQVLEEPGQTDLTIIFKSQNGQFDEMTQPIKISPRGFPVSEVFAGKSMRDTFKIDVTSPVEGSVEATCTVYPSVVEEMVEGLDRMLRQPHGCFEQTSSITYPNLLVYDYLKSINSNDKKTMKKAMEYLDKGYKRLLGFEVKGGGFDWYGRPPSHEGLTAYGLMEFVDMSKVYQVESNLVERTAKWLLSRRNGEGGWNYSKRANRFRGSETIGNAYIVWAMSEAGYAHKIKPEIEASMEKAMVEKDPYLLALMANVAKLADINRPELLETLLATQDADGSWTGKTTSMTNSRGRSLTTETTALAALALMKYNLIDERLDRAMAVIGKSKNQYGFGSTQSTILAMKALVGYTKATTQFKENGTVEIFVNNQKIGERNYTANSRGAIVFDNLEQYLTTKNTFHLQFSNTEKPLPYDVQLSYTTTQPRNSEKCLVNLQTNLQRNQVKMGENIRLSSILTNKDDAPIANPIAIIGIPAGLSVQPWQLKEMQEKEVFDYYEMLPDGYVAFHYRGMEAQEKREIHLDLKADIPGNFEAPASKAYLYYWNEEVVWSQPAVVRVGN